ncbi:MAG: hypothetical protein DA408_07320 [Bacteroidetes bacterium]|nr:MAG: hypothetical protein DA408_07320 [Bacteroidota bacterium]
MKLDFDRPLSDNELEEYRQKLALIITDESNTLAPISPTKRKGTEFFFQIPKGALTPFLDSAIVDLDFQVDNKTIVQDQRVIAENATEALAFGVKNIADKSELDINVQQPAFPRSPLLVLFKSIVDSSDRISFNSYKSFMDKFFCEGPGNNKNDADNGLFRRRFLPFNDTDSYRILKVATETFLMTNVGVHLDLKNISDQDLDNFFINEKGLSFFASNKQGFNQLWSKYLNVPQHKLVGGDSNVAILPFLYTIRRKFSEMGIKKNWLDNVIESELSDKSLPVNTDEQCIGLIHQRLSCPILIELIWSYWHEEAMLVQALNAILLRFQNMRTNSSRDPLAEMEISHLLPLNNLLWGLTQDQQHLLSVVRRNHEYDHHYGISLKGKAVAELRSADSRTRFLDAFHGVLYLAAKYYADSSNKLVEPDAFPMLNALREIHFIIAEGMHNQYGDLPTTARIEMLMQQWILARPELREFLPGRAAVPYTEPWMDRIASMNKLQGWTDTSPMHFNNLAVFGEQILLSIRFGDWSEQTRTQDDAAQWALFFRAQIQGYIHSYKAATGVDLTATVVGNKVDSIPPSQHLLRRLQEQLNGNRVKQNGQVTPRKQSKSELY